MTQFLRFIFGGFFFFKIENRCCGLAQLLSFFYIQQVFCNYFQAYKLLTRLLFGKEIVSHSQSCIFHASSLFLSVNYKLLKQIHLVWYL